MSTYHSLLIRELLAADAHPTLSVKTKSTRPQRDAFINLIAIRAQRTADDFRGLPIRYAYAWRGGVFKLYVSMEDKPTWAEVTVQEMQRLRDHAGAAPVAHLLLHAPADAETFTCWSIPDDAMRAHVDAIQRAYEGPRIRLRIEGSRMQSGDLAWPLAPYAHTLSPTEGERNVLAEARTTTGRTRKTPTAPKARQPKKVSALQRGGASGSKRGKRAASAAPPLRPAFALAKGGRAALQVRFSDPPSDLSLMQDGASLQPVAPGVWDLPTASPVYTVTRGIQALLNVPWIAGAALAFDPRTRVCLRSLNRSTGKAVWLLRPRGWSHAFRVA